MVSGDGVISDLKSGFWNLDFGIYGIIFSVFPVLVIIGPFILYTYTVLVDVGIVAGLIWLHFADKKAQTDKPNPDLPLTNYQPRLDAGVATAASGLIGARLGYVVTNWAYFSDHLGEAFRIWEGGLSWVGAVAGGTLGLWICARLRGEPFWPVADAMTFPLLLIAALAWVGCITNACAPGREVAPGELPSWFAVDWPDTFGVKALRWPTQILGVMWTLVVAAGLWWGRQREWPSGTRLVVALAGIAFGALILAFTRGDAVPQVGGLRLDAAGSGVVLFLALAGLVVKRSPARRVTCAN